MSTEVFRFVTIRPPQDHLIGQSDGVAITLDSAKDPFYEQLRGASAGGTLAAVARVTSDFEETARFISTPGKIDANLNAFAEAVQSLPENGFWEEAAETFSRVFATTATDYASSDSFTQAFADVAATIVAAAIDTKISSELRGSLIRIMRGLWLIRRLAASTPLNKKSALVAAPIVLPAGIFPLPTSEPDAKDRQRATARSSATASVEHRKRITRLSSELAVHRQAAGELLRAFALSGPEPAPQAPAAGQPATRRAAAFLLPAAATEKLSSATKGVLKELGAGEGAMDIVRAVTLVEQQAASIGAQLSGAGGSTPTLVRLGNKLIGADVFDAGQAVTAQPGDGTSIGSPGACPPLPAAAPSSGEVTMPTGHGEARVLGIADLDVVEQELLRYELGEIAHVENVLKSESRKRKFKTVDTNQQTDFTSTESTQEKEQDLSSTTRFEMQTQSQDVINQAASKAAGLTIHASYGPSVDATANYNTTSSTSSQQSRSASTDYAKEITSKAVERVQTRTMTSHTVTRIHQVEDLNRHSFDNSAGDEDIVGVYRYLEKVYAAQIVNYGKRLMLEFVVPEPAAFLRYALTHKPITQVTAVNPDPPGYCVDGATFVGLQASDITPDNYLFWASKYGVQDIAAPPASVVIAQGSLKAPEQMQTVGDRLLCSDTFDVAIPAGYLTQSAFVNIYGETQSGDHRVVVQLQDQQSIYVEPGDDENTFALHLLPTPTLSLSVNSIGFHNYEIIVSVFCTLSGEAFQEWQLKAFNSIMTAYDGLRSSYTTAISEAQMQAEVNVAFGTNPDANRVTEQNELKKSCISLLTGQRFELFDAMQPSVAPYGYPEIDFAEAKAEGDYIQMFEQSFEWNNMTYLFYPYFWGRKDEWPALAQLTDDDPLFAQFLQAGAARVQVPVRPGFEQTILSYLSTGQMWAAEGMILSPGTGTGEASFELSIVDELKSQTGDNNVDGVGTLSVVQGSASVSGSGTVFSPEDQNRRIVIGGATYVIKSVQDPLSIELRSAFAQATAQEVGYVFGGELVGQPWEVKLPTDLVTLADAPSIA